MKMKHNYFTFHLENSIFLGTERYFFQKLQSMSGSVRVRPGPYGVRPGPPGSVRVRPGPSGVHQDSSGSVRITGFNFCNFTLFTYFAQFYFYPGCPRSKFLFLKNSIFLETFRVKAIWNWIFWSWTPCSLTLHVIFLHFWVKYLSNKNEYIFSIFKIILPLQIVILWYVL